MVELVVDQIADISLSNNPDSYISCSVNGIKNLNSGTVYKLINYSRELVGYYIYDNKSYSNEGYVFANFTKEYKQIHRTETIKKILNKLG